MYPHCPKWRKFIEDEAKQKYLSELREYIHERRRTDVVYPASEDVFHSMYLCPVDDVLVVILGQEPYCQSGYEHGMAFSSLSEFRPDVLNNIFREVYEDDIKRFTTPGTQVHRSNNLSSWATQGVLLLNMTLTCEKGNAGAHKWRGWELFAGKAIQMLSNQGRPIVFMLWGAAIDHFEKFIDNKEIHLILKADCPTKPTFSGCKHFSQANKFIVKHYFNRKPAINWAIL